jgi:hypothetical protein
MADVTHVEAFLASLKAKLPIWGIIIRSDRQKNTQTIADLEFIHVEQEIKGVLNQLTVIDYSEVPLEEKLHGIPDMWVFGMIIKGREIYIKLSLGFPNRSVICISFHEAERPMRYPFKE